MSVLFAEISCAAFACTSGALEKSALETSLAKDFTSLPALAILDTTLLSPPTNGIDALALALGVNEILCPVCPAFWSALAKPVASAMLILASTNLPAVPVF